jgi:hypothetical protein
MKLPITVPTPPKSDVPDHGSGDGEEHAWAALKPERWS